MKKFWQLKCKEVVYLHFTGDKTTHLVHLPIGLLPGDYQKQLF